MTVGSGNDLCDARLPGSRGRLSVHQSDQLVVLSLQSGLELAGVENLPPRAFQAVYLGPVAACHIKQSLTEVAVDGDQDAVAGLQSLSKALLVAGLGFQVIGLGALPFATGVAGLMIATAPLALGSGLSQPSLSSLLSRFASADEQGGTLGIGESSASGNRGGGFGSGFMNPPYTYSWQIVVKVIEDGGPGLDGLRADIEKGCEVYVKYPNNTGEWALKLDHDRAIVWRCVSSSALFCKRTSSR